MSAEHALPISAQPRARTLIDRLPRPVRRRPLVSFFVLAYALSWWPSLVLLATGSGSPILGCGPFLAAAVVLWLTTGWTGVKGLLGAMRRWRVGLRWWALAILAPPVLTVIATAANLALGAETPTAAELSRWTNIIPTALLILAVPGIGGAWEEPGWRGYALPGLLARRTPLTASLVLGALWALWHVPLFLAGGQHWSDLLLIVAAAVVFTWVFQNARQSVLVVMVLHAMNNAVSGEYFSRMFSGADSTRQSWLLVLVWGTAAALVALFGQGFRVARGSAPSS